MGNSEVERKQEIITSQMEDSSADSSRKIRKPYTISKSRESWTDVEHDKFIEALQLFDRDWRKIEAFIGSKTVIQIRSHAQKYFKKVEKSGTSEHLPPPRPKRKASHPYPQKAPKNAQNEASLSIRNSNNCSSIDSISDPAENYKNTPSLHGTPDFAQVYSFLGSLFDPNTSDHLQKLKKMDSINVQTILLLMRNLSINLTSPDFEPHRKLLATYSADSEEYNRSSSNQSHLHIGSLVQSK